MLYFSFSGWWCGFCVARLMLWISPSNFMTHDNLSYVCHRWWTVVWSCVQVAFRDHKVLLTLCPTLPCQCNVRGEWELPAAVLKPVCFLKWTQASSWEEESAYQPQKASVPADSNPISIINVIKHIWFWKIQVPNDSQFWFFIEADLCSTVVSAFKHFKRFPDAILGALFLSFIRSFFLFFFETQGVWQFPLFPLFLQHDTLTYK